MRPKSCPRSSFTATRVAPRFSEDPQRQLEHLGLMRVPTKPKRGYDFDPILRIGGLRAQHQKNSFLLMTAKPERGLVFFQSLIFVYQNGRLSMQDGVEIVPSLGFCRHQQRADVVNVGFTLVLQPSAPTLQAVHTLISIKLTKKRVFKTNLS